MREWVPGYRFVVRPPAGTAYTAAEARRELSRFPWVHLGQAAGPLGIGEDSFGFGTISICLIEGEIEFHCREYAMDPDRFAELKQAFGDRLDVCQHERGKA